MSARGRLAALILALALVLVKNFPLNYHDLFLPEKKFYFQFPLESCHGKQILLFCDQKWLFLPLVLY